jgi:prevent-host-death family protein
MAATARAEASPRAIFAALEVGADWDDSAVAGVMNARVVDAGRRAKVVRKRDQIMDFKQVRTYSQIMVREIPTAEAKANFSAVLRMVERGDTIYITRHGRRIAVLQNVPEDTVQARRAAALERMEKRRLQLPRQVSFEEMMSWIREGRK